MGTDTIEIRQLPRLSTDDLKALPQLQGYDDPLGGDNTLFLAGLLDILIDPRRAEILLLLDNRSTDNFHEGNTCLIVGRGFHNLDYSYPRHRQGPIGEPINSYWIVPRPNSFLFISTMGLRYQWDFSFSATGLDLFALEIPGLIEPLPSYGYPGDPPESFFEDNMPKWNSKVNILGVSSLHTQPPHGQGGSGPDEQHADNRYGRMGILGILHRPKRHR